MNTQSKKIFVVVGIVVVLVAIGVGVYVGLQRSQQVLSPGSGGFPVVGGSGSGKGSVVGGEGSIAEYREDDEGIIEATQLQKERLSQMSEGDAMFLWASSQSGTSTPALWYLNQDGEVVRVLAQGEEQVVTTSSFGVPSYLVQNKDGSFVAVAFEGGTWALFDTQEKAWEELPQNIVSVAFSPSGTQLAFLEKGDKKTSLYTFTLGTSKKALIKIATLAVEDVFLQWPIAERIYLTPRSLSGIRSTVWYFDLNKKTLNTSFSGIGIDLLWLSDGAHGLFFSYPTPQTIDLSFVGENGEILGSLPLLTVSSKCGISLSATSTFFCAIPYQYTSSFSVVFPDDFLMRKVFTKDRIYQGRFDGSLVQIVPVLNITSLAIDAASLVEMNGHLFFINRLDKKAYRLQLSE